MYFQQDKKLLCIAVGFRSLQNTCYCFRILTASSFVVTALHTDSFSAIFFLRSRGTVNTQAVTTTMNSATTRVRFYVYIPTSVMYILDFVIVTEFKKNYGFSCYSEFMVANSTHPILSPSLHHPSICVCEDILQKTTI